MAKRQIICDSDVMIDFFDPTQTRHASAKKQIDNIGADNVVISAITTMELIRGVQNKEQQQQLKKRLSNFNAAVINREITEISIDLLFKYTLSHGLSLPDSIIAATAIYTELDLFTYNVKDFKFITGP